MAIYEADIGGTVYEIDVPEGQDPGAAIESFSQSIDPRSVVAPGDVAARQAEQQAAAAAEGSRKVRPDLTIGGEIVGGLQNLAGGAIDTLSALLPGGAPISSLLPDVGMDKSLRENLGAVISSPAARTALGAVQTIAAPLAPLSNLAARAGEAASDVGAPDWLSAAITAGADVLAPTGLARLAKSVAPAVKASPRLQLAKEKAQATLKRGEEQILGSEQRAAERISGAQRQTAAAQEAIEAKAAREVAESEQLRDVGLAETRREAQAAGQKAAKVRADEERALRMARSSAEAEAESARSIAEAAKRQLPSDEELARSFAGRELGEQAGRGFKATYGAKLAERKADFKARYEAELGPADAVRSVPESYKAKVQEILGEGGISRPQPTAAEKSARGAADVLELEDDVARQLQDDLERVAKVRKIDPDRADIMDQNIRAGFADQLPPEPTVRQMVMEQKRLRAAERAAYAAQNDNLGRQFKELQQSLTDDIEKAAPGITQRLAEVDAAYAKDFAPYFSKGAVTRAIAEGDPGRVALDIIRPTSDKKAVEKITKAYQLMDDPAQRQAVAHAHFNSLIDKALQAPNFRESLVRGWNAYTNPSGNANKVLRTAYGKEYDKFNSLINQFKNARSNNLDDVAESIAKEASRKLKGREATITTTAAREAEPLEAVLAGAPSAIESVTKATRQEVGRIRSEAAKATTAQKRALSEEIKQANRARDLEIKEIRKQMDRDIAEVTRGRAAVRDGKLVPRAENSAGKFIGQLYVVESVFDTIYKGAGAGLYKLGAGGMLILSRSMLNRLLASERGVGLLKQAARNAPGSTGAAATARMIQTFIEKMNKEEQAQQ